MGFVTHHEIMFKLELRGNNRAEGSIVSFVEILRHQQPLSAYPEDVLVPTSSEVESTRTGNPLFH
jgi:hypothetical protein